LDVLKAEIQSQHEYTSVHLIGIRVYRSGKNAALEKYFHALELQWMKAEFGKKMDFMGNTLKDDFFNVLYDGSVINKHAMMDRMEKTARKLCAGNAAKFRMASSTLLAIWRLLI
jgi:hypothetical protein